MSSPRFRRPRWFVLFGLAAGCANLIGLSEYEENDDPVGIGAGGDGFSPSGAAGNPEAAGGDGGTAGEPASKDTGGNSPGTGGARASAGQANPGGDGGAPEATGGRRASGGAGGAPDATGGRRASGGAGTGGVNPTGGVQASGGAPASGGTAPTGGSGQGPTSCALPGFSAACSDCIDDSCDAQCDPCLEDAECATLTACLQNCESETCLNGCFDAYEDANAAFLSVYDCAFTTCASVCAPFGSPCQSGGDCESGYCSTSGGGYCSLPCTTHDDCPTVAWCAQDFDGVTKCMPECEDQSECEAGYGCANVQLIDDPNYGTGVRLLCTKEAGILDACSLDSECHASECTGSNGYCTAPCELIEDCPLGSFCVDASSGAARCTLECYDDTDCLPYDSICANLPDTEGYLVDVCEL